MAEQVLIVGAGPTGLMLAIVLARAGVATRIVEKRAERATTSRALAMFARTLEQFDRLQMAERFVECGRKMRGAIMRSGAEEIANISVESLDSPFNFILSLPQAETERLLEEEAARLGVVIERGVELVNIDMQDDLVRVEVHDAEQRSRMIETNWLVGCDGAHSTVRHRLEIPYEGEDIDRWFMFADAIADWELPEDRLNLFLAPEGLAAAFPLSERGLWRVILSLPVGEVAPEQPSLAQINNAFAQRSGVNGILRDARWLTSFTIRQRMAKQFRVGRVFLAGDAAHSHSPAGGQGMNTGLQDAGNLGWKLVLVIKGIAAESLLDTYAAERQPLARAILRSTGTFTKIATMSGSMSQGLRNEIAQLALHFDFVEKRAMRTLSELDVGYRKSALSMNVPGGISGRLVFGSCVPAAGDRAPIVMVRRVDRSDVWLSQLFDVPMCALLIFGCAEGDGDEDGARAIDEIWSWTKRHRGLGVEMYVAVAGEEAAARVPEGVNCLIDMNGEARERYGIGRPAMFGIRPDGVVGFRASPVGVEVLERWVRRVRGHEKTDTYWRGG